MAKIHTFSRPLPYFFCIYPRVQGQSHGLFVSRRLEKSKCNILLGQDAQSRQLSLTEKDRKQSPNLFWLQRGCKLYTYLDFRSRFFQILAKYSKFRCVFFMFQKRQKEENPYSSCLKTNLLVLFLYWNFFGSDWINSHFLSPKRNFKWLRFFLHYIFSATFFVNSGQLCFANFYFLKK